MHRPIKYEPVDGLSAETVARGGNCLVQSLSAHRGWGVGWYSALIQKAVQRLGEVLSCVGFVIIQNTMLLHADTRGDYKMYMGQYSVFED